MGPQTQTKSQADYPAASPMTLRGTLNPSIVLIGVAPSIRLLLSRHTVIGADAVDFYDARLITIPLGWRLRWLRLRARFYKARLPDEVEYESLRAEKYGRRWRVWWQGLVLGSHNLDSIRPLTEKEFWRLRQIRGQDLHRWAIRHFKLPPQPAQMRLSDLLQPWFVAMFLHRRRPERS